MNSIQLDNELNEEDFYFVDQEWLNNIPDPNALVNYHQEYIQLLEDTTHHVIGGLSYGKYFSSEIIDTLLFE